MTKLSNDDVANVIADRRCGYSTRRIANKYGVSQSLVWNIISGRQRAGSTQVSSQRPFSPVDNCRRATADLLQCFGPNLYAGSNVRE